MLKTSYLSFLILWLLLLCTPGCRFSETAHRYVQSTQQRPSKQVDIEDLPIWGLEHYQEQTSPPLNILASIRSEDKYGHQRIQIYIYTEELPNAGFYWKLIERYRAEYDVIWFYLSQNREQPFQAQNWLNQGVWYAERVPAALIQPGFQVQQSQKGLYLRYAY